MSERGNFSLYDTFHNEDYYYMDETISDIMYHGCPIIYVHKYLGPNTNQSNNPDDREITKPVYDESDPTQIQDVLFLENRDRKYDKNIYELRGAHTLQDNDFSLEMIGLTLSGDTIYMYFHYNDMIKGIGRKLMSGDVLELPYLREYDRLNQEKDAINRFYVIQEGIRTAEGFGPHWRWHLWRVKCNPLTDSPEYQDIIGGGEDDLDPGSVGPGIDGDGDGDLSTGEDEKNIMDLIQEQGDKEVPKTGFDNYHLFVDIEGKLNLKWHGNYPTQFDGDGEPPNGIELSGTGSTFPISPNTGDFFLRTDYDPPALFYREEGHWKLWETQFRRDWTGAHKTLETFLNNKRQTTLDSGEVIPARQGLSRVIKPKAEQ